MAGELSWTDGADRVADRERIRSAVESRRRERWRRERQIGGTTTAAALAAAHGSAVTLHLATGTSLHGLVRAAGPDVVSLSVHGRSHHVPLAAVAATELAGGPGDEPADHGATLLEVLEDLRGEGAVHTVLLVGGATVHGQVVGAGPELVLRDPDSETHVVVSLDAIVTIT